MKHFFPLLLLFLFSCQPRQLTPSADILPMEKMRVVLADMHVAEAVAESKAQMQGTNVEKDLVQEYDEQVFKTHHITRADFTKSFAWYEQNPALLNQLYDSILNDLSAREAKK